MRQKYGLCDAKLLYEKKSYKKKVNSLFIFRLQKSPFILLRHLACIQSICCILIENTSYHWFHGKFNRTLLWTYQLHSADQVMSWNKKNKNFRWTLLLSYFFVKSCRTVCSEVKKHVICWSSISICL